MEEKRKKEILEGGNGERGLCLVWNIDKVVEGMIIKKREIKKEKRDFSWLSGNEGILRNERGIGMCRVNKEEY